MAKSKGNPKIGTLAFQDGELEIRSEIGKGKFCSCIKLKIFETKSPSGRGIARAVELGFSYHQAEVLSEILQDFVVSRRCHRKAQTPVWVKWDGATRWSTFPYPL